MEIGQLKAFAMVAYEGNFTRAADKMNLTQPSVSIRIAALEAELGGVLFERGGRQLSLTPLGQALLPYAKRILALVEDSLIVGQRYASGQLGRVTIAALDTLAMYMLPKPMERFRMNYPSIDFSIKLRLQRDIFDMLYDGTATLGLIGAPLWDRGITIHARFQEPVQAVATANHPLAVWQQERGDLSLSRIFEHTIYRITLNPHITALVESVAEQARSGSGGAIIAIPAIMAVDLLLQGQGVAFLPRSFVQPQVDTGQLNFLKITDIPRLYHETLLISRDVRELDVPNSVFVKMVRMQWQHILVD
ncbi:MAG TPA: LysR family transcriptional regulator [Gammaproteobacteria bacterium]|nr:LysR family transcriptional regulator [Gammaproteobacteria bacterium]